MSFRQLRLPLCILACLTGTLRAQIPAGHFLATETATAAPDAGGMFLYEPLLEHSTPLDSGLLGPRQPIRAIIGGSPNQIIAALPGSPLPGQGGFEVAALTLAGPRVIAVRRLAGGLTSRVIALELLPGGTLLVATAQQVFSLRPNGDSLNPLPLPTAIDEFFVDLTQAGSQVVALTRSLAGESRILVFQLGLASNTAHPIDVPGASAISFDPTQNAFLLGNEAGVIFLVDAVSFMSQPTGIASLERISSIAFNPDQLNHLVGSIAKLRVWDGGILSAANAPRGIEVSDIDYRPYTGSFSKYGSGCSQSNFKPSIGTVGRAFPGSQFFAVTLSGAPPGTGAVLLLGRAQTQFPLDFVGMTGCSLLVDRIIRS
ncbi:MAG: DNA polymerase Y subunit UmuC family protein, partial [Planctomycetota bacterium]